uniref:Transposase n=1 Tax=Acrobeloides nanus TaxID=290746 RepID=A0A914DNK4_9BILA
MPKATLGAERYIELFNEVILPACEEVYPDGNFLHQQDGAPAHKLKDTQRFLKKRVPQFVRLNEWTGYSPDVNPCDYRLWAWLKQKEYSRRMSSNLDELKDRIQEAWEELDTETIIG